MTGDGTATGGALRRVALGETGFERPAVWSAVGFALSYVAFDAATAAGVASAATAGVVAAVTAVGAVGFAATGGGVLPTGLLSYGPTAGALLRLSGPEPYATPLSADGPAAVAVAAPLGAALGIAVAAAVVAVGVGRTVGRVRGR